MLKCIARNISSKILEKMHKEELLENIIKNSQKYVIVFDFDNTFKFLIHTGQHMYKYASHNMV